MCRRIQLPDGTVMIVCMRGDHRRGRRKTKEYSMNDTGYSPWGEYSDLDGFGQNAAAQHQFRPSLETINDGTYDCEFLEATLAKTDNGRVIRTDLKIGDRTIEFTYWLNRQESVNDFLAEMLALGFPTNNWGSRPGQTPLSVAIPDCVSHLRGIRFRAAKSSKLVPGKPARPGVPETKPRTFHNLYITGRISGAPMPTPGGNPPFAPSGQMSMSAAMPGSLAPDDVPF